MADFVEGMFVDKPHDNAPEFVKARIGIHVDKLMVWLQNQETKGGYINIQILESKDGSKYYAQVDNWEPKQKEEHVPPPEDDDVVF